MVPPMFQLQVQSVEWLSTRIQSPFSAAVDSLRSINYSEPCKHALSASRPQRCVCVFVNVIKVRTVKAKCAYGIVTEARCV